ncbi:hypothetical protein [Microbacterium sp. H83]|uniref:endonuclease toxin domain-containing protein n=1 Tax=Microbacterium sp. H83 TaxID=1827324 RepID=UPI0007F55D67|nr:hypothetical protein [Microbacterium sp. H83]OAN39043.1 hypothetical protein A4X16_15365 [Microbacterium sp. H83]
MLICVDPTAYASAARMFGDYLASDVRRVADGLVSDLSGLRGFAGHDPVGAEWAIAYDGVAGPTAQAIDDLGRASANVGALLQQSGFNHARAEAYSDVTGGSVLPAEPLAYTAGEARCISLASATGGAIGDPPVGWEWVRDACGLIWPDGDPGRLRETASAWERAAGRLDDGWLLVSQGITALDEVDSPEIQNARGVCRTLKTLDELANRLSNSTWPMPPVLRGFAIESKLGGNLPPGFPKIDRWIKDKGIAISIKTINLASKTYQNPTRLESLVKRYVDKVASFKGDQRGVFVIRESQITQRVLHIGVPRNATSEQSEVLGLVADYAEKRGVELIVEVVR